MPKPNTFLVFGQNLWKGQNENYPFREAPAGWVGLDCVRINDVERDFGVANPRNVLRLAKTLGATSLKLMEGVDA